MRVLVKLLGILDAFSMIIIGLHWMLPVKFLSFGFFYLFFKGIFFVLVSRDFTSYLDMICAAYIVFLYFGFEFTAVTVLAVIYLLQKAVLSIFLG